MSTTGELIEAEVVGSPDEGADWLAAIPATFTAEQGRQAADDALKFARKAVRDVAYSYSGTLPPPPWPAHPELQTAIKNMETIRDFFEIVDEKAQKVGKPATFAKVSTEIKTGPTLVKYGRVLYEEVATLQQHNANAPALKDMLKLVPDPRKVLLGYTLPVPKTVVLGAVALYFAVPRVRRFVRRTLGLRAARAR